MRVFEFVCGLVVLFCTLGYFHIIHHYSREAIRDGGTAGFWILIAVAGVLVCSRLPEDVCWCAGAAVSVSTLVTIEALPVKK